MRGSQANRAMTIHTEDQLARLADVLDSFARANAAMTVGGFDGFVAGLLVCPEAVRPSEWLVQVWGDDPIFECPEDAEVALDALLGHYNRVARALGRNPAAYVPVFDMDSHSGEVSWEAWVEGFDRAMQLRASAWDRIAGSDDDAASVSLSLLIGLSAVLEGGSGLSLEAVQRLDREAPAMIPGFVRDLNAWSRSRKEVSGVAETAEAGVWPTLATEPIHGRRAGPGDPCPCGSGRAYRRCCAAH